MYAPAETRRWLFDQAARNRLAGAARQVFEPQRDVIAVYLYGSAARGEPAVDLDIAVLVDRPMQPRRLATLAAALQAGGAPDGPDIDLRPIFGGEAPRFHANVLREGRLLYEKDRSLRIAREAALMSRWADFKPVWERARKHMYARWSRG